MTPSRNEYYDVDGDEVTETHERCPKCGDTFLANHGDRKHCGKCGFSEIE